MCSDIYPNVSSDIPSGKSSDIYLCKYSISCDPSVDIDSDICSGKFHVTYAGKFANKTSFDDMQN